MLLGPTALRKMDTGLLGTRHDGSRTTRSATPMIRFSLSQTTHVGSIWCASTVSSRPAPDFYGALGYTSSAQGLESTIAQASSMIGRFCPGHVPNSTPLQVTLWAHCTLQGRGCQHIHHQAAVAAHNACALFEMVPGSRTGLSATLPLRHEAGYAEQTVRIPAYPRRTCASHVHLLPAHSRPGCESSGWDRPSLGLSLHAPRSRARGTVW